MYPATTAPKSAVSGCASTNWRRRRSASVTPSRNRSMDESTSSTRTELALCNGRLIVSVMAKSSCCSCGLADGGALHRILGGHLCDLRRDVRYCAGLRNLLAAEDP